MRTTFTLLVFCGAAAASLAASHALRSTAVVSGRSDLTSRDGHHNSHSAPLLQLNETEVLMYHSPTPPSYWTIDVDSHDTDSDVSRYPGLMMLHALLMSLAFFVALPVGVAMRSVKHAWHGCIVIVFYGLCVLGCAASALYTKLTPNMYEHQIHSRHGYFILFASACLSILDLVAPGTRLVTYFRSSDRLKFNIKHFWCTVILGREDIPTGSDAEYAGLVVDDREEVDDEELKAVNDAPKPLHIRRNQIMTPLLTQDLRRTSHYDHDQDRPYGHSATSERTLFDVFSPAKEYSDDILHETVGAKPGVPMLRRIARGAFGGVERALVFAGFGQLLTGIVVYTGGCRENFINGCMAHLIKGGIFWCYGLVTFARFLGSFSELGWAWNRAPSGGYPSAEFVESFVIFFYGITNTWMERFGANPGDPYTTKQVQHISIAVMFWFAGLIGMGIESRRVRRWLAASVSASAQSIIGSQGTVDEPPSYVSSFNPFPALVIGVTGAAMSAHAQTYLFQVQIHALWGYLLVAFSVLRCLTYFFVWLGPPRSVLPSRPPTEALGSFFLACGGLTFIFSTEEITFAAMRRGRDDVMMFMNLGVALTCFAFCWTFCIVAFKGWLESRSNPPVLYRISA